MYIRVSQQEIDKNPLRNGTRRLLPGKALSPFCVVGYCTLTGWFRSFFSRIFAFEAAILCKRGTEVGLSDVVCV